MQDKPQLDMDLSKIKAVAFDVDGILTDGGILAMPDGDLLRVFDSKDAFGIRMARMKGIIPAIITGGSSESIAHRMVMVGVAREDIYLHSRYKLEDFQDFCRRHNLQPEEVMYFGDDLPDIDVLKACGCAVAPADAVPEVKEVADIVSPFNGGKGCVRHAMELLLKSRGQWSLDSGVYKKMF